MFAPLKGLRVIDLTQVLAGPYATYQLALMGAQVIKVENPDGGDWARAGQTLAGHEGQPMGAGFLTQNANKQSVVLDLKKPEGLALLKKLIATADIFVENFRPGTAAKLGLSFEDVKAVNNKILYASISAYGQDGPIGHRPAYDHVVQGMCGIMTTTGTAETAPNKVGSPYIDYVTGLNAAFAITAGLAQQRITGQALRVDVAMLDSAMLLMASMLTQTLSLGTEFTANGNEAFSRSPSSGAFDAADGLLMIAANNDRQFRDLCSGLGRADILNDARWSDPATRAKNQNSLREQIAAAIKSKPASHWETELAKLNVPAARVRTIAEVLSEDQLKARALMTRLELPGASQPAFVPSLGFKVDGEATCATQPPRPLGADTDQVLQSLGLSAQELANLRTAGVLGAMSKDKQASG